MAAQQELRTVALDQIDRRPQVRELFDEGALRGLAQSLAEAGMQQPLLLRACGERYVLVDGERRFLAAQLAGWASVPAVIDSEEATEAEAVWRQLTANLQRADLSPMETARGIDRLMRDAQWSAATVAAKLGLSPATVSKLLALIVLPPDVQAAVHRGELAASTAYEIAKQRDPVQRASLAAEALQGKLTREVVAARSKPSRSPRPTRAKRIRARRVSIPLGSGRWIAVVGPTLSLAALTATLEQLLARIRDVAQPNAELRDVLTALAKKGE